MKDCPACGKTTPEEERRCTNCGERLGNPLLSELGNVRPVSGGVLLVLAGLMDSYTPLSRMMGSTPAGPDEFAFRLLLSLLILLSGVVALTKPEWSLYAGIEGIVASLLPLRILHSGAPFFGVVTYLGVVGGVFCAVSQSEEIERNLRKSLEVSAAVAVVVSLAYVAVRTFSGFGSFEVFSLVFWIALMTPTSLAFLVSYVTLHLGNPTPE